MKNALLKLIWINAAFTKPNRSTSEARGEFQLTKMLSFGCWNERCRLMRGAAFTLAEVFSSHCAGFRKSAFTLAEVFSSYCANFKKAAFTLAEVLITLAVIGVVAAMTLPTLIQNHQKQAYVTGLKKAVSVSQNMLKKMQADEGVSSVGMTRLFSEGVCENSFYSNDPSSNGCEDAYGNPSVFEEIIPKYLKVVKTCSDCNYPLYKNSELRCSNNDKCTLFVFDNTLQKACNYMSSPAVCANTRGFYTNDGMIYYVSANSAGLWRPSGVKFGVDVNGEKGPNILGRDMFIFVIEADGKISGTAGWGNYTMVNYLMRNGWKMDY